MRSSWKYPKSGDYCCSTSAIQEGTKENEASGKKNVARASVTLDRNGLLCGNVIKFLETGSSSNPLYIRDTNGDKPAGIRVKG